MTEAALIMLYALSAWGASLNVPTWARMAWRRWRAKARPRFDNDRYLLARTGLTLLSSGIGGLAGMRLAADLFAGVPIVVPHPAGVALIGMMALAEPLFLRVDCLDARERGTWSATWRIYWTGVGVGGAALATWIVMGWRTG